MTKKQSGSPTATRLGIRLRQELIMQRGMVGMASRRLKMKREKINQVARKMEEWAEMEVSPNFERQEAGTTNSPGINSIDGDEGGI